MLFWITAIALALAAAFFAVRPLLRRGDDASPRAAHDAQVFRDQLRELERDVARGVVAAEDADATRLEVSRRLLAADEEARARHGAGPAPRLASVALAVLLTAALPIGAALLYLDLGAPGARDMPFDTRGAAARISQAEAEQRVADAGGIAPRTGPDAAEYAELVTRLEARLAEMPNDRQGVFLYARSLMNLGRFAEAHVHFTKLIALDDGKSPADIYAGQAEAMVLAAQGYVSPEAESALLEVLKRAPTNPSARYYLGRLHAQNGDLALAENIWGTLLAESNPDAPWVAPIRAEMADLGITAPGAPALPPLDPAGLPGPTTDEMQAAGSLPEADRQAMVADMVTRLQTRLDTEGGTVAEWQRLIRSYSVLGQQGKAQDAMEKARAAFAGDPAALMALETDSAPLAPAQPGVETAPDAERAAQIDRMIGALANRLATDGGPPEDWLRLITSLSVMGRAEEARAVYQDARTAFEEDPSSLAMLEAAIEGAPRPPSAAPTRGPSAAEIEAAKDMAAADRAAMIEGMVVQLHTRLREEDKTADVNEWGKLMRSYKALDDDAAVRAAYDEAIAIFADDALARAYLKEAALLSGAELN